MKKIANWWGNLCTALTAFIELLDEEMRADEEQKRANMEEIAKRRPDGKSII